MGPEAELDRGQLRGGDNVADVAGAELAGHHRCEPVRAGASRDLLGHVEDPHRRARADVVGADVPSRPLHDPLESGQVGPGDVGDVHEVAHLAAVLEDRGGSPASSWERKIAATPAYGVSRGIPGP